jgi:hypothetical protein
MLFVKCCFLRTRKIDARPFFINNKTSRNLSIPVGDLRILQKTQLKVIKLVSLAGVPRDVDQDQQKAFDVLKLKMNSITLIRE